MTTTRETTKVFLNTWGAYNDGSIGYGWMTPEEAATFIKENRDRDGGEWFIADIDNYLGVDFGNLDCADVFTLINTIEQLDDLDEYERNNVIALMEYLGTADFGEAYEDLDRYTFYSDIEEYFDSCDECLDFGNNELLERYFDYDAFHRDCKFDIYEADNGVCILE
jgi:hypothetical protein